MSVVTECPRVVSLTAVHVGSSKPEGFFSFIDDSKSLSASLTEFFDTKDLRIHYGLISIG